MTRTREPAAPRRERLAAPLAARLSARLTAPTDVAGLVAFRVVFGLVVAVSAARFLSYGWIDECFVAPTYRFHYWGFAWVEPLSSRGMHAVFWALLGLGLAVAAGLVTRLALGVLVVAFAYVNLLDVTNYLNHYYLLGLLGLLLCAMPVGRAGSVDAWLFPSLRARSFPTWCTWLLRLQVGCVYVYAGLAKANADWLLHAQPLGIWLRARSDTPLVGALFDEAWVAYAMSWAGFLFDTTVPFFLLGRRTRVPAYVAVLGFHAATQALFPIGMFPTIMAGSALVFFSPSWPRVVLARLGLGGRARVGRRAASPLAPPPRAPRPLRALGFALGAAFALVQVLFPLRHRLYGGNVLWHEQGMRLSWKVMAREKNASVTYRVVSPSEHREWEVNPRRWLSDRQLRDFGSQPDLVLQLAHAVAADFRARGHGDVRVHADVWVSLNGRRAARLVDPNVDLVPLQDSLATARFVLPEPVDDPLPVGTLAWQRAAPSRSVF